MQLVVAEALGPWRGASLRLASISKGGEQVLGELIDNHGLGQAMLTANVLTLLIFLLGRLGHLYALKGRLVKCRQSLLRIS